MHSTAHLVLVANLRIDQTTPSEFPILATLGMRNARPRDHELRVRIVGDGA